MPYIDKYSRSRLDDVNYPLNAGEIQYLIARMINVYLNNHLKMIDGSYKYQDLNDIMGALSGAQMEFYRKVVAPYEELKIRENGGVYD